MIFHPTPPNVCPATLCREASVLVRQDVSNMVLLYSDAASLMALVSETDQASAFTISSTIFLASASSIIVLSI